MNFNKHLELNGGHAVFGASQSAWLRYDDNKMLDKVGNVKMSELGTELHDFAKSQIDMGLKARSIKGLTDSLVTYIYRKYYDELKEELPFRAYRLINGIKNVDRNVLLTLQQYINDGVGFSMSTEQKLVHDPIYFYGTADAICYRDDILRIHDFKSGVTPAKMDQLMIYAAYFCLEYKIKPTSIKLIELRIYQQNDVLYYNPEPVEIQEIMDKVVHDYKMINDIYEVVAN